MISKFVDWMLSPLTRRVRREVEAAMLAKEEARHIMPVKIVSSTAT